MDVANGHFGLPLSIAFLILHELGSFLLGASCSILNCVSTDRVLTGAKSKRKYVSSSGSGRNQL